MRSIVNTLFLAQFLLLLLGCTKIESPQRQSNELVLGLGAPAQTLDPRFTTDATGQRMTNLIFQSLVKIGPNLSIQGDAAKSWRIVGNDYIFNLPKSIQFHNGRSLNQDDIEFSIQSYKMKQSPFASMFESVSSIEIKEQSNEFIVRLKMGDYSAPFLNDLERIKLLPAQEIKSNPEQFILKPIGSGAFKLAKSSPQEYLLERVEKLPGKADFLRLKIIRDDNTRFQKLLKGEIDVIQNNLPFDKVDFISKNKKFQVKSVVGPSMTYLLINHRDPLLKKLNIRKAIAHSLDLQKLIKHKHKSMTLQATSILTPGNFFFNDSLTPYEFDLSKANEYIKKENLNQLQVELRTSSSPSSVENAKVLSFLLKKAGIQLSLKSYEWGIYYDDIKNGRFQMALMKWIGAIDPDIYRLTLHSEMTPPGRNRGHFSSQELDTLVVKGLKTKSPEARKKIYSRVQEIAFSELATIPLWYEKQIYVLGPKIQNFHPPKSGDFSGIAEATLRK